ncbi:MAG: L-threonylcarbamoyladenylate synthase [Chitinophagales bacterium]|nr:L-threonylcarbamoyladenylate synthase [Chitinophagales bacterium]
MTKYFDDISEIARALNRGEIGLVPTDTLYGLSCDATNLKAIDRLKLLKHRSPNKSLIVLFRDETHVLSYFDIDSEEFYNFWKPTSVPTSFLLPNKFKLPVSALTANEYIAIRIPNANSFLTQLWRFIDFPIVSTSANFSGEPTALSLHEVDPRLKDSVDFIVDDRYDSGTKSASELYQYLDKEWKRLR